MPLSPELVEDCVAVGEGGAEADMDAAADKHASVALLAAYRGCPYIADPAPVVQAVKEPLLLPLPFGRSVVRRNS